MQEAYGQCEKRSSICAKGMSILHSAWHRLAPEENITASTGEHWSEGPMEIWKGLGGDLVPRPTPEDYLT